MGFFGLFAFILAALGTGFFIPVFLDFINTGLVDKFPTLIVCGFVIMGAIQAFFAGLILSHIVTQNRRDFEYRFTLVNQKERTAREEDYK